MVKDKREEKGTGNEEEVGGKENVNINVYRHLYVCGRGQERMWDI